MPAKNLKRLSRLDIPGGGQVVVQGDYAFVGHMQPPHGTTIVDVSDPAKPRVTARIELPDPYSHTHKVRVAGDLMIVNSEMFNRHVLRKGADIPAVEQTLAAELRRPPTAVEIAGRLGVDQAELPQLREAGARGYTDGGFKIYDISDKANPRLLTFHKTHGVGVHRFDCDRQYAYISTEK
ncbi:MAG: RNA polymerase subunit sigma-70, partial [bacterium]